MGERSAVDRGLDPTISLAVILNLPLSTVEKIGDYLAGLPDVHVVTSKVGPRGSLWIVEGREPPREGRP